MNYGSATYGSAAIGGSAASQWFMFLPYLVYLAGNYSAELEFSPTEPFFSLFMRKATEELPVSVEAFTRNDPSENPQSQGTFDGQFAQYVIGSARFIKVTATLSDGNLFEVRGRSGD